MVHHIGPPTFDVCSDFCLVLAGPFLRADRQGGMYPTIILEHRSREATDLSTRDGTWTYTSDSCVERRTSNIADRLKSIFVRRRLDGNSSMHTIYVSVIPHHHNYSENPNQLCKSMGG